MPNTWDTGSAVNATLSNGNLTVTATGASGRARSVTALTGKGYAEFKVTNNSINFGIGIANASENSWLGNGVNSIGVLRDGTVFFNGAYQTNAKYDGSTYGTLAVNDIVQICWDAPNGRFWFQVNGTGGWNTWMAGDPTAGTGYVAASLGTIYLYYEADSAGPAGIANFGSQTLAYSPPSGFSTETPAGSVGTIAGVATVSGVARAHARTAGTSAGSATVSGVAKADARTVGTSTGLAAVNGVPGGQGSAVGTSAGSATVNGAAQAHARTTGTIGGSATVSGVGQASVPAAGSAAGSSTVSGVSGAAKPTVGTSSGQATVSGRSATGANSTVGLIQGRAEVQGFAGFTTVSHNESDIVAMDAANSAEVGIYITEDMRFSEAMDAVANSVGAWYGFDQAGKLRMSILTEPDANPAFTLTRNHIGNDYEYRSSRDEAIPNWATYLNYAKNWTLQTSDLAVGAMTQAHRQFIALEYRTAPYEQPNIRKQHLLSTAATIDTLLIDAMAAASESARRAILNNIARDIIEAPVPLSVLKASGLWLMSSVKVMLNRYGLENGKSFRVFGVRLQLSKRRAILRLWG